MDIGSDTRSTCSFRTVAQVTCSSTAKAELTTGSDTPSTDRSNLLVTLQHKIWHCPNLVQHFRTILNPAVEPLANGGMPFAEQYPKQGEEVETPGTLQWQHFIAFQGCPCWWIHVFPNQSSFAP